MPPPLSEAVLFFMRKFAIVLVLSRSFAYIPPPYEVFPPVIVKPSSNVSLVSSIIITESVPVCLIIEG